MHRHRHRSRIHAKRLVAMAVLAACSWGAHGLTLGRFQVLSSTGEPLRAEVEITEFTPQELQDLRANIAPVTSFQAAGMEFNPGLAGVTARIEKRSNGRPYIVLTGQTPLRDHFIDVILETHWNTGRLIKNYALLLHPASNGAVGTPTGMPTATTPAAPAVIASNTPPTPPALATPIPAAAPSTSAVSRSEDLQPRSVELNARQVPVYRFDTPPATVARAPSTDRVDDPVRPAPAATALNRPPAGPVRVADDRVQVESGDTLSQIALARLPAHVSLDQMMVALLQSNPQAFIDGNVNLIKAGTVLQIPNAQQVTGISREEARRMVAEQTRAFIDYARQVGRTPLRLQAQSPAREVSGQVEEQAPAVKNPAIPRDTLTLSQGAVSAASETEQVALSQALKDTTTQVAQVNRNLQDLQALADGRPPAASSSVAAGPSASPQVQAPAGPAAERGDNGEGQSGFMAQLTKDRNTQIWAGALVLAVGLIAYWISRRRREDDDSDFAPQYEDMPAQPAVGSPLPTASAGMPPLPDLDLNLDPATAPPTAPGFDPGMPAHKSADSSSLTDLDDTDQSKLNLAAQLIARGEHDLARTLLESALKTSSAQLRQRAQNLLSQLP